MKGAFLNRPVEQFLDFAIEIDFGREKAKQDSGICQLSYGKFDIRDCNDSPVL